MESTEAIVAVITRTKNRNLLLARAVDSVLCQTFTDWQHVIVNDGGDPDAVEAILEHYENRYAGRLLLIHNEVSLGMEAASNIGINASASKYVCIHDDDDSWHPDFLRRCTEECEKCEFPSVKGVVAHTIQIFETIANGEIREERRQELTPGLSAVSIPQISEVNRFMPIAFLFERSVLAEIGKFDESLPVVGDWEFNVRFLARYDVIVIRENLAEYHVRTHGSSEFANTVTANWDKHEFYRTMLINKHMRKDLDSGRLSLGMLLGYGDYFHHISGNLSRLGVLLDKLKRLPLVNRIRKSLGA
jgi:glycosyltransferase involved in cell wall biosynthesis